MARKEQYNVKRTIVWEPG